MQRSLFAALLPAALAIAVPAAAQAPDPGASAPPLATGSSELEARLRGLLAKQGGLTSDQAAQRAFLTSVDAKIKDADLLAAAADVDRALIAYYPRLTLTGRYARLSSIGEQRLGTVVAAPTAGPGPIAPGTPLINVPFDLPIALNQYLVQANLTVPVSDYFLRTGQSVSAATETRAGAEIDARAARLSAALQARVLYYAWARAQLQEVVALQSVEQARSHKQVADAAFSAGRGSRADVLRSESVLARAELLFERARNLRIVSEEQLRTATHDESGRSYEIGEDLLSPLPDEGKAQSLSQLFREAQQKRLELRALDRAERALTEQRRANRASYYPRLDAFGNAYYANPHPRYFPQRDQWNGTWDLGVQLSWTPNDVGYASATSAGLEARRARVVAQKAAFRDALMNEVTQAYHALREAEAGLETSKRGQAAAEEAYRVRKELYSYGRATSDELIDSESDVLRAGLELISTRIEQRISRARLEHALGRDIRR